MEKAFDYLREHGNTQERNVCFAVTCGLDGDRGVYLREPADLNKAKEIAVTIEPKFLELNGLGEHYLVWVAVAPGSRQCTATGFYGNTSSLNCDIGECTHASHHTEKDCTCASRRKPYACHYVPV